METILLTKKGAIGQLGLQTVHPEKPAAALDIPAAVDGPATIHSSVRAEKPANVLILTPPKPQGAAADSFTFPGLGQDPTMPPQITPAPSAIGSVVIGGAVVPVNAVPAATVTFGPHVESPMLVGVGDKTMTLGVPGTYGDTIVAIKTAAGGATVAVVGNVQNGAFQTYALNGGGVAANAAGNGGGNALANGGDNAAGNQGGRAGGGTLDGGAGGVNGGSILAPTPAAISQQGSRPEVMVAGMTFTPVAHGGYSVAGTSLSLGGTPITIYDSSGAAETTDPHAGSGKKPSPTVLSLTTDASGAEVIVINGETSTLPTAPLELATPRPTQTLHPGGTIPTSGLGSDTGGSTDESANAISGKADHKNTASHEFFGGRRGLVCGVVISIMAMIPL